MAATVQGNIQNGRLAMGANGRFIQWGQAAFSTTDATGTIPVQAGLQVESVLLTPIGAPNTDETLYWGDSPSGGILNLTNGSGTITVGRTGTKTSGLKFSYMIIYK